jgi:hypothetical protein
LGKDFLSHGMPFYLKSTRAYFKGRISLSRMPKEGNFVPTSAPDLPMSALSSFLLIIAIIFNCLNRDMQDEWMNRMIEGDGIQF